MKKIELQAIFNELSKQIEQLKQQGYNKHSIEIIELENKRHSYLMDLEMEHYEQDTI